MFKAILIICTVLSAQEWECQTAETLPRETAAQCYADLIYFKTVLQPQKVIGRCEPTEKVEGWPMTVTYPE